VITIDTRAPAAPAAGAAPAAPAPAPGTLLAIFTPKAADAMIATAKTTDAEVAAIAGIKEATKVTIRKITVGAAADAAAVNKAKADNAAETAKLQAALNANAAFKAELTAKMVDPATIVAMEVAADGTVTLYSLG
jgi:hypothetical protein